jgi:hypothetical protein
MARGDNSIAAHYRQLMQRDLKSLRNNETAVACFKIQSQCSSGEISARVADGAARETDASCLVQNGRDISCSPTQDAYLDSVNKHIAIM